MLLFLVLQVLIYLLTIFVGLCLAYLVIFLFFTTIPHSNFETAVFELKEFQIVNKKDSLNNHSAGGRNWLKKQPKRLTPTTVKRRIVVSRDIDKAIQDVVDELLSYYIFSWYKPLINDDRYSSKCVQHLRHVIRQDTWLLISTFIDRLYTVNYLPFITSTLIKRLLKHFESLKFSLNYDNLSKDNISLTDSYDLLSSSSSSSSTFYSLSNKQNNVFFDPRTSSNPANLLTEAVKNLNSNLTLGSSQTLAPPSTNFNIQKSENSKCFLQAFLFDQNDEGLLQYKFIDYMLDILYKESRFSTKIVDQSRILQSLLNDILSFLFKQIVELISDPYYINLQLLKLIRHYQFSKDVNLNEYMNEFNYNPNSIEKSLNLNRKSHIITEMKKYLNDNNFTKIYDIIDNCDEIDLLKSIRLLIVGEILNVSVIEHLSRLKENRKNRNKRGSKNTIEYKPKSNMVLAPDNDSNNKNDNNSGKLPMKYSLLNLLNLNSSTNSSSSAASTSAANYQKLNQNNNFTNIKLKVPTESKIKLLQIKDLRRFNNHLRFTKTLCEQKILALKRQNAKQIFETPINNRRLSINSNLTLMDDSLSFFELSNNHFDLSPSLTNNNNNNGHSDSLNSSLKNNEKFFKKNKKKIYQFKLIIINDISREWLKRFVMNSLFSQDIIRSSKNQFKIDSLLSQCCSYLIDVWENCERLFEKCYRFYQIRDKNPVKLNELIHDCYLLAISIVYDERFTYTFSNKFLQLPNHILRQLENFLIGQLSLSMIEPDNKYYEFNNFLKTTNFDPEIIENTSGITRLVKLNFEPLWKIFYELENIIHHCLQEEIYPQFLISNEYDQMLTELDSSSRASPTCNDPFLNFTPFSFGDKWKLLFDEVLLSSNDENDAKKKEEPNNHRNDDEQKLPKKNLLFENLHSKSLQKILINSEMIDLTKNRNILLNSLEFGLGSFIYLKSLCEARLQFKIFLKHLLTRNFDQKEINNERLIIHKIAKILKGDILVYHSLYNDIHKILIKSFLWLHSDFTCQSSEFKMIYFLPENNANNSNRQPGWKSNTFLSTFVGNLIGTFDQQAGDYDLQFMLSIQSDLLPEFFQQFDNDLKNQLKNCNHSWNVACSVNYLHNWLNNNFTPNLRMLTFLSRFNLLEYLNVFLKNIGIEQQDKKKAYSIVDWKDLSKRLYFDSSALQRYSKDKLTLFDVKGLVKSASMNKFNNGKGMSFKNLLKNDEASLSASSSSLSTQSSSSSSPTSSFSASSTSSNPQSSVQSSSFLKFEWPLEEEKNVKVVVERLMKHLTDNPYIVRMNAFLSLIKFDDKDSRKALNHCDSSQCLRCQLYELLLNDSWSDLNGCLLVSMFRLLCKNGLSNSCLNLFEDKSSLNAARKSSNSSRDNDGSENTLTAISVSGLATGRLFAMQSNSPSLSSAENGGDLELFLLHSRSLLIDRPAIEIFDYLLGNFRYFGNFCVDCVEKITQSRPIQASSVTNINKSSGHSSMSKKFRLFQQFDSSTIGIDVVASLDDNLNTLEVLDIVEDDAVDGEDNEEDAVVEQLFQLLIEVFQLKGSVAKTFRRTLMLAFRLLFGSTMVSKHFKLILESIFADKNILLWLNDILHIIKEWNIDLERNRTQKCQEMSSLDLNKVPVDDSKSFNDPKDEEQLKRLQILTKQLLFTSVPSFASALFGQENLNVGLNKCFDILQYRQLNKQLCYEFLEAFTLEYFADNIKK